MMMVHAPHKGAVDPEHSLNLGRMGKLKLLVDISLVIDRPPAIDTLVNASAVSPQL